MPKIASIVDRRSAISVTADGYIDLVTASGYLNSLKNKRFAITMWFVPKWTTETGYFRYCSAESEASAGMFLYTLPGEMTSAPLKWGGDTDLGRTFVGVTTGNLHNATAVVNIGGVNDANFYLNGVLVGPDNSYTNLSNCHATIVRLGERLYLTGLGIKADFGPFSIMDLSNGTVSTAAKALAFASAIYAVGPNGEQMRRAIRRQDQWATGYIWKINDIPNRQTSATHTTIERYNLVNGVKEGTSGTSISAGTGVALLN